MRDDLAFLRCIDAGVTIELRVQPRARRTSLELIEGRTLRAAVTAPAEDGRANRAVIALLAGEWRLPKSSFAVTRGAAARDKVLSISGQSAALAGRIGTWAREQARHHG